MTELITIDSIVKNDEKGKTIINGINARVLEGEFITIIGPSGAGKSTLLSLLNRMIEPDDGKLLYLGQPYPEIDVLQLRRTIGMVYQTPTMLKGTVKDNLLIGPSFANQELTDREIDNLLQMMGLPSSIKNKDAKSLSGGEKQRVSLARTLANKTKVLLLDEVTASLDPDSILEVEEYIKMLNINEGITVLWVTHNVTQAKRLGKYTWVLADGQLVEQEATKELFNNPRHPLTKRYILSVVDGQLEYMKKRVDER